MAKPVAARVKSASALRTLSPTWAPTRFSSTRSPPLATTSTADPVSTPRNTIDLAIWSTSQPMAAAASSAVRVESVSSTTGQSSPSRASSLCTSSARSLMCVIGKIDL